MENSRCVGLMAVLAVSSSVALVVLQFHRRLVADFMKKAELELSKSQSCIFMSLLLLPHLLMFSALFSRSGGRGKRSKKKVTFAADVVEPSNDNKEYRRRKRSGREEQEEASIAMAG